MYSELKSVKLLLVFGIEYSHVYTRFLCRIFSIVFKDNVFRIWYFMAGECMFVCVCVCVGGGGGVRVSHMLRNTDTRSENRVVSSSTFYH